MLKPCSAFSGGLRALAQWWPARLRALAGVVLAMALGLGAATAGAQSLQPVPELSARVTDRVGALSADQRAGLEQQLAAFEQQRGTQIAVLITDTVQPESIEQYALRVAEAWRLGRQGVDDGALLLIALKDRKLRIEVGYGLEASLSDVVARRIIGDVMTPRLKAGDIYGAVDAGVGAMIAAASGEPLPAPSRRATTTPAAIDDDSWSTLIFVGFVLVFFVGGILRALFGRLLASVLIGGAAAACAWYLVGALLVALGAGVLAFFVSLVVGLSGFRSGGFPGGGVGGGGFGGGGGFSGGGGGFGGGGASGRW